MLSLGRLLEERKILSLLINFLAKAVRRIFWWLCSVNAQNQLICQERSGQINCNSINSSSNNNKHWAWLIGPRYGNSVSFSGKHQCHNNKMQQHQITNNNRSKWALPQKRYNNNNLAPPRTKCNNNKQWHKQQQQNFLYQKLSASCEPRTNTTIDFGLVLRFEVCLAWASCTQVRPQSLNTATEHSAPRAIPFSYGQQINYRVTLL